MQMKNSFSKKFRNKFLLFRVKFINLFFIFTFLPISQIIPQDNWFSLDSPTDNFLRTLQFTDSLNGWVGGDSGLVLHTTNGGDIWTVQETNTNVNIVDLFFLDENRGWGLALEEVLPPIGTTILKTINGGENWEADFFSEDALMFSIYFLDTLYGFMGGNGDGAFVRTTDGGATWRQVNIAPLPLAYFPVVNIKFFNNLYGFACGGQIDLAGVVWKTDDGGNLWTPIDTAYTPPDQIWDIHYIDSLNLICAGGDPEFFGVGFLQSSDAGNSWIFNELGIPGVARAISFRNENEGWSPVPGPQSLLYSLDSGNTWTDIPAPADYSIYDLVFTDSLTGYGVGEEGAIIKYKYPVIIPVTDDDLFLEENFILYQNFPNPFNPVTNLKFQISFGPEWNSGIVSLKVYDVLGIEIAGLVNEEKLPGVYEITFDATDLPNGIYFYRLQAGTYSETKKMILLK